MTITNERLITSLSLKILELDCSQRLKEAAEAHLLKLIQPSDAKVKRAKGKQNGAICRD